MQRKSAEFASAGAIRAISLHIFDRCSAATDVPEIAAVVMGLALRLAIVWISVEFFNPQSFH